MKNLILPCIVLCTQITFTFAQNIVLESFATGLNRPVNIKHAGDDRLFVVEQNGYIQIVNTDGSVNTTPFLNIDDRVFNIGGIGDERGLLGLAFHPNYLTNGFFYVNYINNSGNTVVSRFTVDSTNSSDPGFNTSDPNSELIILSISQPFENHNGGDLAFGQDGYLYIASGDGGSGGDPGDRAQALNTLLGKMLRIDIDNTSGGNNYAIPADNPYFNDGNANTLDEIWAYGLRNPWKFSFDSQTNDIWIADVGQNVYEEINMVSATAAGINYGWRCYEASSEFNITATCLPMASLTFPVAEYSHSGSGAFKCSVTGGYRYRGTVQTALIGVYFFADYCSNEIGLLTQNGGSWQIAYTQQYNGNGWTAFGEDVNNELYITGISSGEIFKIVQDSLSIDEFETNFSFKMYPNPSDTGNVFLDFSEGSTTINQIAIYNLLGKRVQFIENINVDLYQVSTENMSSGLYIIEVSDNSGNKEQKKLVIY